MKMAETQVQHDAQQRMMEGSKARHRTDLQNAQKIAEESAAKLDLLLEENETLRAQLDSAESEDDRLNARNLRVVFRAAAARLEEERSAHREAAERTRFDVFAARSEAARLRAVLAQQTAQVEALQATVEDLREDQRRARRDADDTDAELERLLALADFAPAADDSWRDVERLCDASAMDALQSSLYAAQEREAALRENLS